MSQCLAIKLFDVMKMEKPYNNARSIENLKKRPEESFDENYENRVDKKRI